MASRRALLRWDGTGCWRWVLRQGRSPRPSAGKAELWQPERGRGAALRNPLVKAAVTSLRWPIARVWYSWQKTIGVFYRTKGRTLLGVSAQLCQYRRGAESGQGARALRAEAHSSANGFQPP